MNRATHMTKPDIDGIAPFFIVKSVPAELAFCRDALGFDITLQGPIRTTSILALFSGVRR